MTETSVSGRKQAKISKCIANQRPCYMHCVTQHGLNLTGYLSLFYAAQVNNSVLALVTAVYVQRLLSVPGR